MVSEMARRCPRKHSWRHSGTSMDETIFYNKENWTSDLFSASLQRWGLDKVRRLTKTPLNDLSGSIVYLYVNASVAQPLTN